MGKKILLAPLCIIMYYSFVGWAWSLTFGTPLRLKVKMAAAAPCTSLFESYLDIWKS